MLSIKDLHVSVEDKAILRGLSPVSYTHLRFINVAVSNAS